MAPTETLLSQAFNTLEIAQQAIASLKNFIDEGFFKAVETIRAAKGRTVVTGIGKSAIIAQKLVATFNSTGTPALFMHAADAIHGDLGMVQPEDVVLIISKSGNSPEIKVLIPFIKGFGNPVIALCGNASGYLATHADCFVNCTVEKEACPHNLAPSTSTTAQMVMGDALAICLLQLNEFTSRDFAKYHPGGALGKRLYLRVADIISKEKPPQVNMGSSMKEVIYEISSKRLGATAVMENETGKLAGIITDGDIRRALEHHENTSALLAENISTPHPKKIDEDALAATALELMRTADITQLIVTKNGNYTGMLHLHDLLREGII